MRHFHHIHLVLLCFTFSLILNAQQSQRYRSLTTSDGLSQNSVYTIVQDQTGFIWIGTKDGLNRYDGYNFKVYRKKPFDSLSISGNWIQSLFVDSKNQLWIGTFSNGLNRLNAERSTFKHFPFPQANQLQSNNRILAIYESADHNLWIGSSNGLYMLQNEKLEKVTLPEQISITTILEDGDHLWLGTWGLGLYRYHKIDHTFKHYSADDNKSIGGNYIRTLISDSAGKIWLIAYGGGLSYFDTETERFTNYQSNPTVAISSDVSNPNSFNQHLVWTITETDSIHFWLGYSDGSILIFNRQNESFSLFQSAKVDQSAELISQLFMDRSGLIWIAGTDNGIRIYNPRIEQFNHKSTLNSRLSSNQILSAFIENEQTIWIGTDKGLVNYNPQENSVKTFQQNYRLANSLSNNRIESILVDSKKRVWVGTYNGLNLMDPNRQFFTQIAYRPQSEIGLSHPFINSLVEDKSGSIWIGTFGGGLNRYNPETKKVLQYRQAKSPELMSSDFINMLYLDSKNQLWIGTVDAGFIKFSQDGNSSRFYRHQTTSDNSLSHNNVQTFVEDNQGRLWIGTYGGGLNLLLPDYSFQHFTQENGFFNNSIVAMQLDEKNKLWIATNSGLVNFNVDNYNYTIFDENNGLQGNQFSKASSIGFDDNLLLFAGNNGINLFNASDIIATDFSPSIVINASQDLVELKADQSSNIDTYYLPYNKNYISFELASLDFTSPNKNLYRYRMEKIDEDWSNPSRERFINYSNLESGTYTFEFKGSNNEGFWSGNKQIQIIVDLPFYSKISFQITVFLFLTAFVFWLYRIRLSKLAEIEKTRYLIARDLHDEIGGTLTGIGLLAEAMSHNKDQSKSKSMLKSIKNNVAVAQETMSDIIWSISPKNDNWHDLLKRMNEFSSDVLESQSIQYSIDSKIDFEDELKMERRQHLWRIFKELITNIARHSNCKKATITVSNLNGFVFLEIKDDGIGFDPDTEQEGNGLKNIKSRANLLGASISFTNNSIGGCQWQIKFKN